MRLGYIFSAFLLSPVLAISATIYVPDNYGTIQDAIDASSNGDTITANLAAADGGGIYCLGKATIKNNTITGNEAGTGGGIYCDNSNSESTLIMSNTITNNDAWEGGGIRCDDADFTTITKNTIWGNAAYNGGGISCYSCSLTITSNWISNNEAWGEYGGGISCRYSDSLIVNNIIKENSAAYGGGIGCTYSSDPEIVNNTITQNRAVDRGGGLFCNQSSPSTANSILWDNSAMHGSEIYDPGGGGVVYSDIRGGWPGTGNIDSDPLFADALKNDYHITWNSPCRDTGWNCLVTESYDLEGDPRIAMGAIVDMGADEYWFHTYHIGRIVPGSTIDVKVVGWPSAPVTLAVDDSIVDPPISTPHGDFYISWPPIWYGNIGKVPGNGILTLPVTIPLSWSSGETYFLQSLVGPWGGPWTRLTNAEVLTVE